VEVLRAARERVDLDQVATDGLGERSFFAASVPGASRASVISIEPTTSLGRRMIKPPCVS